LAFECEALLRAKLGCDRPTRWRRQSRPLAPLGARVVKSVFPTTTLVAPATRDWNSSRAGENVATMKLRRRE
jgi:hypothetical protein